MIVIDLEFLVAFTNRGRSKYIYFVGKMKCIAYIYGQRSVLLGDGVGIVSHRMP